MCLYFPHFSDTSHRERYTRLIEELGATGYGYYWFLVEALGRRSAHKLSIRNGYAIASLLSGVPKRYIKKIVEEYGLFIVDRQAEEFYEPMLIQSLEQAYLGKPEQAEPEEDEQATKPKYTLSDKAIEARKRGGKIGGKKTKSEFKQTKSETKSEDKQTKSETKQTKSEAKTEFKQTKSETKSATYGGTIGGQAPQKDKRAKDKKEDTPQAPQGAGESLDSGLESSSLVAGTATATPQPPSTLLDEERPEWLTDDLLKRYYRHNDDYDEPDPQMKRVDDYMVQRMLRETEELMQRQEAQELEREYERAKISPATVDEVCALYERYCQGLIPLTPYDRYRISEIAQLLRSQTLAGIERIFRKAGRSPFLRGEVNGWRASLGWLIKTENYHKVLAGNYDKRKIQDQGTPSVGIPIETSDEKRQKLLERMERNVIRTPQTEEQ